MEDNRNNPEIEERDATLDEDVISSMTEDELQESILEDSGMNGFQKFCARMPEPKWVLTQRIVGALLGIAAGMALFWDTMMKSVGVQQQEQQGFFSMPLVLAVLIAMVVPNILEKQSLRRIPKLRTALVIGLGAMIVIYFIVIGASTGFKFTV